MVPTFTLLNWDTREIRPSCRQMPGHLASRTTSTKKHQLIQVCFLICIIHPSPQLQRKTSFHIVVWHCRELQAFCLNHGPHITFLSQNFYCNSSGFFMLNWWFGILACSAGRCSYLGCHLTIVWLKMLAGTCHFSGDRASSLSQWTLR